MPDAEKKVTDLISKMKEKGLIPGRRQRKKEDVSQIKQSAAGNENIQAGRDINVEVGRDLNFNQHPIIDGPYTIPCPNCKNGTASNAAACPECGLPVAKILKRNHAKKEYDRAIKVLIALGIVLGALCVLTFIVPGVIRNYVYYLIYADIGLIIFGFFRMDAMKKELIEK